MNLSADERETTFSIMASDHKTVTVWSNDPFWQRRLEKLVEPSTVTGESRFYQLDLDNVRFTVGKKREMSDEQRQAAGERLMALKR